jgi:hypothetical protein
LSEVRGVRFAEAALKNGSQPADHDVSNSFALESS